MAGEITINSKRARTDVGYRHYLSSYWGVKLPPLERAPGDQRTLEELHEDQECDHDCEICAGEQEWRLERQREEGA